MEKKNYSQVIAIDGPSGSGKSTVAKNIAKELGLTYINTGAMFRALALVLNEKKLSSEQEIDRFLANMDFQYAPSAKVLISINNTDFTHRIQAHEVSGLASYYSQFTNIRSYLGLIQRKIASSTPCVLEGRDIGSVIFPDAAIKVYLTASIDVRARRRLQELRERAETADKNLNLESMKRDIQERDEQDKNRKHAPLVKAKDAVEIDASHMTIGEVEDSIIDIYNQRKEMFHRDQ